MNEDIKKFSDSVNYKYRDPLEKIDPKKISCAVNFYLNKERNHLESFILLLSDKFPLFYFYYAFYPNTKSGKLSLKANFQHSASPLLAEWFLTRYYNFKNICGDTSDLYKQVHDNSNIFISDFIDLDNSLVKNLRPSKKNMIKGRLNILSNYGVIFSLDMANPYNSIFWLDKEISDLVLSLLYPKIEEYFSVNFYRKTSFSGIQEKKDPDLLHNTAKSWYDYTLGFMSSTYPDKF